MSDAFFNALNLSPPQGWRGAAGNTGVLSVTPTVSFSAVTVGPRPDQDLDQLYALVGPDGSSPYDTSNSKAAGRLNELALSMAYDFVAVKKAESAFFDKLGSVKKQSRTSETELKRFKASADGFKSAANNPKSDIAKQSSEFVNGLNGLQASIEATKTLVLAVDEAMIGVREAGLRKSERKANRDREEAQEKYNEKKEEIKEQQERFKGALEVVTKLASVEKWTEIIPDALSFVDQQLFNALPRQELKDLKKKVDEATAALHDVQDELDMTVVEKAFKHLDVANSALDKAYNDVSRAATALAMLRNQVVSKLSSPSSPGTAAAAAIIQGSQVMMKMITTATAAGNAYSKAATALQAECKRTIPLFSSFGGIIAKDQRLTDSHKDALTRTAKQDAGTLGTWADDLQAVLDEVRGELSTLADRGKSGYMANYNEIQPELTKMLGA